MRTPSKIVKSFLSALEKLFEVTLFTMLILPPPFIIPLYVPTTLNVEEKQYINAAGIFTGWVNNAAVFRDASIHSSSTREVLDAIALNLNPTVVGCATAIRRFLAAG